MREEFSRKFAICFVSGALFAMPSFADEPLKVASKQYVDSIVTVLSQQPDWNQTNIGKRDYIKNKPTLGTASAADTSDFATVTQGTKADTAVQPAALNNYIPISQKAAANGVASLDVGTKVPIAQLPTGTSATTIAMGNDSRFDAVPTSQPVGTAPSGYAWIYLEL
ncbi:MAG: hypothetical protein FWE50_01195 [Alphaproteobacteria bacterium]|nr:hypothetical protein [Alphaproteobacteria bacterium]